ncbi:MAG TPA: hypothetical protein EYG85_09390 [Crocinitomix sp.]|nr:hypothetical protein [Crocinitomix sp.]
MKKSLKIVLVLLFLCNGAHAIKLNPRKKYPFGASIHLLGPSGHLALSVNAFVVPKINIELGTGLYNANSLFQYSTFIGGKYHFGGNSFLNTTFYLGVYDAFSHDFNRHHLYFPLGLHKIKRNQLTWSVEVAFQPDKAYYDSTFWGAFKVGYQFGIKTKKQKKEFSLFKNKK